MEIIITLLILGILVFAVACTPAKKTAEAEKQVVADAAMDAVEDTEKTPNVGGACTYDDIEGMATITFLNMSNIDEVVIKFDFSPSGTTKYKYSNFPDKGQSFFVKGYGCCPPLNWCKENGIKQGAKIKCVRSELSKGACTPVVFNFRQFEKNGW